MTSQSSVNLSMCCRLSVTLIISAILSGCGDKGTADQPQNNAAQSSTNTPGTESERAPTTAQSASSQSSDPAKPRRQNERWKDANGVEYLGDVPLDVFYDQPYVIASDRTPLGGTPVNSSTGPANEGSPAGMSPGGSDAPEKTEPETAVAAKASWSEMMPAETLKNEVNSVRNFLKQSLQNVGTYKRSMLMIPPKAASMAVLSGIAMEHSEEISWKEDAVYIRDLAKRMNEDTLKPVKNDWERLQRLFESIDATLDRSRPADLEDPAPEDTFVDVADMGSVMNRMEEAQTKLKTEAGSESAFESKKDMIKHEAAILRTMTHVITIEGYGYADDEEFLGYSNRIIEAAKKIGTATDVGDFDTYELSLSKISTACQECHSAYRNN